MLLDGFAVMVEPAVVVGKVTLLFALAGIGPSDLVRRAADALDRAPRRRNAAPAAVPVEVAIVTAYNSAWLEGWPPGEQMTFEQVSRQVEVTPSRVRSVIARRWRR